MVNPKVHLFRGAPSVRSWSKYRETVKGWTLCGIKRGIGRKGHESGRHCVEDASQVSCPFCLVLMRSDAFWRRALSRFRTKPKIHHGLVGTLEYRAWNAMMKRGAWPALAHKPESADYRNYRAKGITVCERWWDFPNFLADMGPKPSPLHTLDRIDGNGNYEPGNCRWATRQEQNRNYSRNRRLEFRGETRILCEWAESIGISADTLGERLKAGLSVEQALTLPKVPFGERRKGYQRLKPCDPSS